MGFLSSWLKLRAARKISSGALEAELAESYGTSDYYTLPQVKVAYEKLALDKRHINVAFAEFLNAETYMKASGNTEASYEADRALYKRFRPHRTDSAVGPAPVNEYVRQLGGL